MNKYALLQYIYFRTPGSKALREDSTRGMYISNVTEIEVTNADEAYAVLIRGIIYE